MAAELIGIAICAILHTAPLILGYFILKLKNNSYISKLTFMQNNHNFMFDIFSLSLL